MDGMAGCDRGGARDVDQLVDDLSCPMVRQPIGADGEVRRP